MSLVIFDKPLADRTDPMQKMVAAQPPCPEGLTKSDCYTRHAHHERPALRLVHGGEEG